MINQDDKNNTETIEISYLQKTVEGVTLVRRSVAVPNSSSRFAADAMQMGLVEHFFSELPQTEESAKKALTDLLMESGKGVAQWKTMMKTVRDQMASAAATPSQGLRVVGDQKENDELNQEGPVDPDTPRSQIPVTGAKAELNG